MPSKLIFIFLICPEFFLLDSLVEDFPDLGDVIGDPGTVVDITVKYAILFAGEHYFVTF